MPRNNMRVIDIFSFLNATFPVDTAEEFDNVGILIGDGEVCVSSCIVALDCTGAVIQKAISQGAGLIITHHPVIFDPLKTLTAHSIPALCIKNGISVISMHTNMDKGAGGVNDALCAALGLENVKTILALDGFPLRTGTLPCEMSGDTLGEYIKTRLGGSVRYNATDKKIKTVAVCSGSGGGYLFDAVSTGADAFITGDIKHNVFTDAQNMDFPLFDAGHFYTEDVIVGPLTQMLAEKFPTVKFIAEHCYNVNTI